jgi:peptidyl-prolyl cis-trans isomerase B (cyclophilin B)
MSQTPTNIPRRRLPLVIATTAVLVAGVVAIAIGVNQANNAGVVPSATPKPTPRPTPTPNVALPATPCNSVSFGAPLAPLDQPANVHVYTKAPALSIDTTKLYQATITTARGKLVLCLEPTLAPNTVNNFVALARNHFFDGIPFHRVVANFVIQAGDPNCIGHVPSPPASPTGTCGQGGPGYKFNDEPVKGSYTKGCLAMANSGPNTNGSQFFICTADDSTLAKSYSLFGALESTLRVALQIKQGDVMQTVTVQQQA